MLSSNASFSSPDDVIETFKEVLEDPTVKRDTTTRTERLIEAAEDIVKAGGRVHLVEALREWLASPTFQQLDYCPEIASRVGLDELTPDLVQLRSRIEQGELDTQLQIRSETMRGSYLRRLDLHLEQMGSN